MPTFVDLLDVDELVREGYGQRFGVDERRGHDDDVGASVDLHGARVRVLVVVIADGLGILKDADVGLTEVNPQGLGDRLDGIHVPWDADVGLQHFSA